MKIVLMNIKTKLTTKVKGLFFIFIYLTLTFITGLRFGIRIRNLSKLIITTKENTIEQQYQPKFL